MATKVTNISADSRMYPKDSLLSGKLITSSNSTMIGENDFQELVNMRYSDGHPSSIAGMTKISSSIFSSGGIDYTKVRDSIQILDKENNTSKIICQVYNSDLNSSLIVENTNIPPATGNFSTVLYTVCGKWTANTSYSIGDKVFPTTNNGCYYVCVDAGTSHATTEPTWNTTRDTNTSDNTIIWSTRIGDLVGKFSKSPDGCISFCNGFDTLIYPGNEFRVGNFINTTSGNANPLDYTERLGRSLLDSNKVISLVSGGNIYIGSPIKLSGVKFYVATPNSSTSTMTAYYWNGSTWTSCSSQSDGTSSGGITLAQTGSLTFTSTVSVAKQSFFNDIKAFWYKIACGTINSSTRIFGCTVKASMQQISDIWDGEKRPIIASFWGTGDNILNVVKQDWEQTIQYDIMGAPSWKTIPRTVVQLDAITSSDKLYFGFSERMSALNLIFVKKNSTTNTLSIDYWNGSAWTTVGTIEDSTSSGGKTFNNSGLVSWNEIDETLEFKTTIQSSEQLYFYRLNFSGNLDSCELDVVQGIPTSKKIDSYKFSETWLNSLWLCGKDSGQKNSLIGSMAETFCVYNGNKSYETTLGDNSELVAGCTIFSRFQSDVQESLLLMKKNETWVMYGTNVQDIIKRKVSSLYGCVAPRTLSVCDMGFEITSGVNKSVAIWQSQKGIVVFDNNTITEISGDISNYFTDMYDSSVTERINPTYIESSVGFYDPINMEYHWIFIAGDALRREFVYDLRQKKWYKIERGSSSKALISGNSFYDTKGNVYMYGFSYDGYIQRLEYGNTFDGNNIISYLRTADKVLEQSIIYETLISYIKIVGIDKSTASSVVVTLYKDGESTGTVLKSLSQNSSNSIFQWHDSPNKKCIFYSIKLYISSNDSNCNMEPLAISVLRKTVRNDSREDK